MEDRNMRIKKFLLEYFGLEEIETERPWVFLMRELRKQRSHYEKLLLRYDNICRYPGYFQLREAVDLINDVLKPSRPPLYFAEMQFDVTKFKLLASKKRLEPLENFFLNQVSLYDRIYDLTSRLWLNMDENADYDEEALRFLNRITMRCIVIPDEDFDYEGLPETERMLDEYIRLYGDERLPERS